jgi:hypothetical protein
MEHHEKNISLRLTGKLLEKLQSLTGGKKNLSEVIRDRLDAGFKIADQEMAVKQQLWRLQDDPHLAMSEILGKYLVNLARITPAEVLFMAVQIQQYYFGGCNGVTPRRYIQLVELVDGLYSMLTGSGIAVDEHYLASKLRAQEEATSDVRELLRSHCAFCAENKSPLDTDGLTRALLCLAEDSWQLAETKYLGLMRPDMDLLVTLASNALFAEKPYTIPDHLAQLQMPISERRTHKGFSVSVYDITGFDCVIEIPYALVTTDFRGFTKLRRLSGLMSAPGPMAFLQLTADVRLCFPTAEDAAAVQKMCDDIAATPAFAARSRLLALAHGVAE